MVLNMAELGWAACAIDAEGTITHATVRGENRSTIRVSVFNTDPRFVLKMRTLFGIGTVTSRVRVGRTGKTERRSYTWTASQRQAGRILEQVLPHLVIKREQAELALAIMATMRNSPGQGKGIGRFVPPESWALRQDLSARLKVVRDHRPTLEEVS